MVALVEKEISIIKNDIPKLNSLDSEYVFSLLCLKYFYNEGELSIKDFRDSFVDGKGDGGIDLIAIDERSRPSNIVLIQSKMVNSIGNKQDIIDMCTKINQTINDFNANKTNKYNRRLKKIFKEKRESLNEVGFNYEIAIFLGCELSKSMHDDIHNKIECMLEFSDFTIAINDINDINAKIESYIEKSNYVTQGKIKFFKEDGVIKNGEDGMIVNISSNSLKNLFDQYRDKGLFEQNFRYFIKNKKIDDSINASLKYKRQDFWYLNNGIIIGCQDFDTDGYNVNLYNFSIVNGCQTASLIGSYDGKNENEDFRIQCKIIRSKNRDDGDSFISNIAEASNSQKPILERDLKANAKEQRNLKRELASCNPPIYLEIKRGESKPKKGALETWQYLKNDLFGQLLLSFIFQQPGTARSSKQKIFTDNSTYNKLFKRTHDFNTITDILKINFLLESYINERLKDEFYVDDDEEDILLNGNRVILATLGFILKMKRNHIDLKLIHNEDDWAEEVSRDDIRGKIFADYGDDDFHDVLKGTFSKIVTSIHSTYVANKQNEKSVSNFFKSDVKYRDKILKYFVQNNYIDIVAKKQFNEYYLKIFA